MIDFIKNLFTGILSFLSGLIGGKNQKNLPSNKAAEKPAATTTKKRKSSGYFMELDEADEAGSLNGNQIVKSVTAKISELADSEPAKGVTAKISELADSEPAKGVAAKISELTGAKSAKEESTKTPEPAGAKSAKRESAKTPEPVGAKSAKGESAKTPEPVGAKSTAKVELVQTAEGIKAEPKKPEKASANLNGQNPTETTFAPKYLAPSASSSKSRRRPGPNMNSFLDMARQVKTPG